MFEWNSYFENKSKPEILEMLSDFDDKVIFLKDTNEIESILIKNNHL